MLVLLSNLGLGGVLKFFTSPGGRIVMIVAAFGLWTLWNRIDAAHDVREQVERQQLEEFQETLERINEEPDITDRDTAVRRLCELAGLTECPVPGDAASEE